MCLRSAKMSSIAEFGYKRVGWKGMYASIGHDEWNRRSYRSVVYGGETLKSDTRQHAKTMVTECMLSGAYYPAGFHIFTKREDAIDWMKRFVQDIPMFFGSKEEYRSAVVEVEYQGTLCSGIDETGFACDVAASIMLRDCTFLKDIPNKRDFDE